MKQLKDLPGIEELARTQAGRQAQPAAAPPPEPAAPAAAPAPEPPPAGEAPAEEAP
jgi:2-oxoglutarate dehydrogenase E2 component (dihydrolipoamide succinyltransferase)